ncbi:hypothetical protein ABT039_28265 [Streptomyces lasiicapitis]|uniref:Uncharacterized protein n=1 Tax=Streptomyces lasiicapitis TaxID=1923961 RepID=A0ABQ2LPY9_9ACTN|nr:MULTISPECIES: hypothetical protein [Streptomyces]QIB47449.1 hypothetical protein G3H79_34585 [Streptomyces aureoverticillatus]GGO41654.1 hypothetical protein GCM10012286_21770 [Streptomyces lasiicapitis]
MSAAPFTMPFTVRSDEPVTHEHVLPQPDGALVAEVHRVSGLRGMRNGRLVASPARELRARAAHHALLGLV